MKNISLAIGFGLITSLSTSSFAANEALMDLFKILRSKGSLTEQEYELLVNAARADEEKTVDTGNKIKSEIREEFVAAESKSGWTDKLKFKGDIRTRYQGQWEDGATDRHRGRVRYRLGLVANPVDKVEVGAGLASGSDDLRSTNQSFDTTFSTKGINLDYAYAQYRFNDNLTAIAGKFKRGSYLWRATDLMWDGDINPEGFSLNYSNKNDYGTTFLNSGIWVLEENSGSDEDPYLIFGQLGQKFSIGEIDGRVAGTYYNFGDINAVGDIVTDGTNTDYRFDAISLSGELVMGDVFGKGSKAGIFADWVNNIDTDSPRDNGYAIGFKAERGAWDFKYIYADLEENAWPDILPDSDRFDGLTGIDGHEFIFNYDIMKNVTFGLDYYMTENSANVDQNLLQVDLVIKY